MDDEWLAGRFEDHRSRLRGVAYRMLGSLTEADDAVQDAWERVSRAGADDVENLGGWLTTIVARVCLNMLRTRKTRRESSLEFYLPDPIVSDHDEAGPEEKAMLADSVGLALQIVLHTLSPDERVAFVLHDMFDLPFDQISPMLDRTPQATRQLASRARRRIKGANIRRPEGDLARQRAVVDAFYTASRAGDLDALVALLHPDVTLRVDSSPSQPHQSTVIRGAALVAHQARLGAQPSSKIHPAVVNGAAGYVITRRGRPFVLMAFTVNDDKITEIDVIGDRERVERVIGTFSLDE
jgi:RNA polymerase sigma factor (sigma-70 family)